VQGRLLDDADARPLAGAWVTLVRDGENVARAVTRVDGGFRIIAPTPGRYLLRADFLGYGTVERDVDIPPPGEPLTVELRAAQRAIELEGLVAEVDKQCDVPQGVAAQVANLWEEVGQAFQVTAFLEEEQLYDLRMDTWRRSLEPRTLRVLEESREQSRGIQRGSPFRSLPPEELAEGGYVREDASGDLTYYAPDARVLLSTSFQDTHCFGVTIDPPEDADGEWVGIRFDPRRDDRPDIRGVLWIDAVSLEPQRLDFQYSELPGRVGDRDLGGRVVFRRLPEGPWIVQEWWIRMPLVQAVRYHTFDSGEPRYRYELTGIDEAGGEVTQAGPRGGPMVALGATGQVEGRVTHPSGAPAAGARVALEGTVYRARADADGRFLLEEVPEGRYHLAHTSPLLDSLQLDGGTTPVTVTEGEATRLEVRLPSAALLLARACTEPVVPGAGGVLRGVVAAEEGAALEGVAVEVTWAERFSPSEAGGAVLIRQSDATATVPVGEDGRWMACGLPTVIPLTVRAVLPEVRRGAGPEQEVRLREGVFPTLELEAPDRVAMAEAGEGDASRGSVTILEGPGEAGGAGEAGPRPAGGEAERVVAELSNLGLRREALGRRFLGPAEMEELRNSSMDALDLVRVAGLPGIRVERLRPSNELCIHSRRNMQAGFSSGGAEPICASVFIDGVPADVERLAAVPGESLAGLAYLRPGEAGARFGSGTAGGVLVVWTRSGLR
jgi:hypothetical protein